MGVNTYNPNTLTPIGFLPDPREIQNLQGVIHDRAVTVTSTDVEFPKGKHSKIQHDYLKIDLNSLILP